MPSSGCASRHCLHTCVSNSRDSTTIGRQTELSSSTTISRWPCSSLSRAKYSFQPSLYRPPLSSCATHFDYVPCLSSSCTLSCLPLCCSAISSWAYPFFSFLALACLTSSWWYPPLPSLTRGHTIAVVSSWGTLSLARHWLLSRCLHSWCGPSWSCSSPSQHSHLSGV